MTRMLRMVLYAAMKLRDQLDGCIAVLREALPESKSWPPLGAFGDDDEPTIPIAAVMEELGGGKVHVPMTGGRK